MRFDSLHIYRESTDEQPDDADGATYTVKIDAFEQSPALTFEHLDEVHFCGFPVTVSPDGAVSFHDGEEVDLRRHTRHRGLNEPRDTLFIELPNDSTPTFAFEEV